MRISLAIPQVSRLRYQLGPLSRMVKAGATWMGKCAYGQTARRGRGYEMWPITTYLFHGIVLHMERELLY